MRGVDEASLLAFGEKSKSVGFRWCDGVCNI